MGSRLSWSWLKLGKGNNEKVDSTLTQAGEDACGEYV
jgi:hypothetical protein